jgi:hypothetical protein
MALILNATPATLLARFCGTIDTKENRTKNRQAPSSNPMTKL